MLASIPILRHLKRKKQESKAISAMTWQQREAKVTGELREAESCIASGDAKCTSTHLVQANRYEDCPVCRRRIGTFEKQVKALPREKQMQKIQLIQKFISPSAEVHRQIVEADAIKPSRARMASMRIKSGLSKVKNVFRRSAT